jgi:hypothetical protein
MQFEVLISLIRDVLPLLALIIGGLFAIFIYSQFAPILNLRIIASWADEDREYLKLKFEIENKSRVRVNSPLARIQMLEHKLTETNLISEWVPFHRDAIKPEEAPIVWREPERVFKSTERIFPGETLSIERLVHCSQDKTILHIGFQVQLELGLLGKLITGRLKAWRQTTTAIMVKH